MKQEVKKSNPRRNFYWAIAILCLIYGGVSLIILVQQSYFLYLREHFMSSGILERNASSGNLTEARRTGSIMILPLITTFLGSLISILGGISLLSLLRKKESREIRKDLIESIILPDEKLVIQELERNNGELTQSELVRMTRLSKVKVHRIVKRLVDMEIVKKYPYGLTNKIKLEKTLLAED